MPVILSRFVSNVMKITGSRHERKGIKNVKRKLN